LNVISGQVPAGHYARRRRRGREAFIIKGKAPEPNRPGKGSFHHPMPRQQDKTAFGLMMFDHFQPNAFLDGGLGRLFSGVALVDKGYLHRFFNHSLHGLGHLPQLGSILFVGRHIRQTPPIFTR